MRRRRVLMGVDLIVVKEGHGEGHGSGKEGPRDEKGKGDKHFKTHNYSHLLAHFAPVCFGHSLQHTSLVCLGWSLVAERKLNPNLWQLLKRLAYRLLHIEPSVHGIVGIRQDEYSIATFKKA